MFKNQTPNENLPGEDSPGHKRKQNETAVASRSNKSGKRKQRTARMQFANEDNTATHRLSSTPPVSAGIQE